MKFDLQQLKNDINAARKKNGRKVAVNRIAKNTGLNMSTVNRIIYEDDISINVCTLAALCSYLKTDPAKYFINS